MENTRKEIKGENTGSIDKVINGDSELSSEIEDKSKLGYNREVVLAKLGDNGKTYVEVKDVFINIKDSQTNAFSPRSIKIIKGLSIELGRPVQELKKAISKSRLPLTVKKIQDNGKVGLYSILRLTTGNIPTRTIATIKCSYGKIISVAYNTKLNEDREFRKHCKLSMLHQVKFTLPSGASNKQTKERITNVVKMLFRDSTNIKIFMHMSSISVNFEVDGQSLQISLPISFEGGNISYKLASISLLYYNKI